MQKLRTYLACLAILTTVLVLTACQPTAAVPATVPGIRIDLKSSTCPAIAITAGDQITWNNLDQEEHQIRIINSNGKLMFDSGTLKPGDSAAFTIPLAGSFTYTCTKVEGSTATIIVEP